MIQQTNMEFTIFFVAKRIIILYSRFTPKMKNSLHWYIYVHFFYNKQKCFSVNCAWLDCQKQKKKKLVRKYCVMHSFMRLLHSFLSTVFLLCYVLFLCYCTVLRTCSIIIKQDTSTFFSFWCAHKTF